MKRYLEDRTQDILDFLFPDGMGSMSESDKDFWFNHARGTAMKLLDIDPEDARLVTLEKKVME
jgi:hypothetical protein